MMPPRHRRSRSFTLLTPRFALALGACNSDESLGQLLHA
jgi:hypothetical protein